MNYWKYKKRIIICLCIHISWYTDFPYILILVFSSLWNGNNILRYVQTNQHWLKHHNLLINTDLLEFKYFANFSQSYIYSSWKNDKKTLFTFLENLDSASISKEAETIPWSQVELCLGRSMNSREGHFSQNLVNWRGTEKRGHYRIILSWTFHFLSQGGNSKEFDYTSLFFSCMFILIFVVLT